MRHSECVRVGGEGDRPPAMIIARTVKGKGVPFIENRTAGTARRSDEDDLNEGAAGPGRSRSRGPRTASRHRRISARNCQPPTRISPPEYNVGDKSADSQRLRQRPGRVRARLSGTGRAGRGSQQFNPGGLSEEGPCGPVLRNVHCRTEHGRVRVGTGLPRANCRSSPASPHF